MENEIKYQIDWNKLRSAAHSQRENVAADIIQGLDYYWISDILQNRDNGASAIMRQLDVLYGCNDGVKIPSLRGEYRLRPYRPFAVNGSYDYEPGDVVRWKQQIYNRLPLGIIKGASKKKLTKDEIDAMTRRGELEKIMDYGQAVVDEHGLITVGYQDACQLLANNGFIRRESFGVMGAYGICTSAEFSNRQVRHETKEHEFVRQTRRNWLFIEVMPWEDPAKTGNKKRKASVTDSVKLEIQG